MIKIPENGIPSQTVKDTLDALRREEQASALQKEIGDEATGSAHPPHRP